MYSKITANKVIEMADEGMISYRDLAMMALKWMSEDDVAEMCKANDLICEEVDEEDLVDVDCYRCSTTSRLF